MKAGDKIILMIELELGFKELNLDELHMIKGTLDKEIEKKNKLLFRGKKLHNAVEARKKL